MAEDYQHSFLPNQKKNATEYRVIENKAKSTAKVMWPKIITYASMKDCLPREYHYFDKENKLKRVLTMDDVKTFDGHKLPTHWEMKPVDDNKKKTTIIYNKMKFKTSFKSDHFTHKNLTDF